ncbi:MAG: biotin--[acetyl-CoA-carboxylase] ligase [Thermodesulfobacteriota bacterium]
MDSLASFSPALLEEHIRTVELARRQRETGPESEKVFRYGAHVGSRIRVFSSLDRAMGEARAHIASREKGGQSVADGSLILASTLSLSKGRFSRSWHAPPGGLWGCLILADTFLDESRALLPLIPGVAACEALHEAGAAAAIRWVNDVLVQGKKQGGFLIETVRSPIHGEDYHLLGFGLNINNDSFPSELRETAVSLAQVLGHPVDLSRFALSFLAKLRWYVGLLLHEEQRRLMDTGGEEHPLVARWKELSDSVGRRVLFGYDVMETPQYEALVTGVGRDGALLLRHDDGSTSVEHSGEIRYLS